MNQLYVQPRRLNEWLNGFLCGCGFVAGVATVTFFLVWTTR